jgi:protease PrsW
MDNLLILIALAVVPCILVALFIYWRDKLDSEPINLMVGAFFGGIASVVPAYFLSSGLNDIILAGPPTNAFETAVDAFICVALAEEFSKYIFLRYIAYRHNSFNLPFDGVSNAIMVGMGFAMVENLLYVLSNGSSGFDIALMRMYTAIPAHLIFAILMGYFVGLAKRNQHHTGYLFVGVLVAVLAHGIYDYFIFTNQVLSIKILAAVLSFVAIFLFVKALRQYKKASPPEQVSSNGDGITS